MISAGSLSEQGRKVLYPVIRVLFIDLGFQFVIENVLLEIKFGKRQVEQKKEEGEGGEDDQSGASPKDNDESAENSK